MIQLQRNPLPSPQADAIRKWLDMPAALEFQRYLSAISAEATANAGNCLLERDEPDSKQQRKDHTEMAFRLDGINNLIDEMRGPDYKFEVAVLQPRMHSTTTNPT